MYAGAVGQLLCKAGAAVGYLTQDTCLPYLRLAIISHVTARARAVMYRTGVRKTVGTVPSYCLPYAVLWVRKGGRAAYR